MSDYFNNHYELKTLAKPFQLSDHDERINTRNIDSLIGMTSDLIEMRSRLNHHL